MGHRNDSGVRMGLAPGIAIGVRRRMYFAMIGAGVLGAACAGLILRARNPELAKDGCPAFHGMATGATKGEGGNRVGAGFNKGDTLAIEIYNAPGAAKASADILQYSSPDGPFRAITEWVSDSFTYTVPRKTGDFIYLNFSAVNQGMIVSWCCTPAMSNRRCNPRDAGTLSKTSAQ